MTQLPNRPSADTAASGKRSRPRRRLRKAGSDLEAIIAAAAHVFGERGYHATSLDDIAERLGVSKPTIYYHVGNKEALLAECLRRSLKDLMDSLDPLRNRPMTGADRLEQAVRYCVAAACTDLGRCVVRIPDHVLDRHRAEILEIKGSVSAIFSELLSEGINDGSLACHDHKLFGQLLRGLINSVGDWFQPGGKWTETYISDAIVRMSVEALRS